MQKPFHLERETNFTNLRDVRNEELHQTEGGAYPIYTEDGEVITCTDPRRSSVYSGSTWSTFSSLY